MDKYYREGAGVYNTRPYHALSLSDGEEEDDDVCVWNDRPELPEPEPELYESDEPLYGHLRKPSSKIVSIPNKRQGKSPGLDGRQTHSSHHHNTNQRKEKRDGPSRETKKTRVEASAIQAPTRESKSSLPEISREREIADALSTAHRSLTRMSQFMLKVEARTGKATKEGIRQTLDATVRDNTCEFGRDIRDQDHKADIDEIKSLSMSISHRLWLVDRHWRRQERLNSGDEATENSKVGIHGEEFVKDWLEVETQTNYISADETCFYTGSDLANNRNFREWLGYLRKLGKFRDTPRDEDKFIELAWCFLDRRLRGPLPPPKSISIEAFVLDLETKQKNGAFAEVLKNPNKQVEEDGDAWNAMRQYWSAKIFPE